MNSSSRITRSSLLKPMMLVTMNQLACSLADDVITRKMVEEFVEGEEGHCAWVAKHLGIIKKLGYDNYLLEMMDI